MTYMTLKLREQVQISHEKKNFFIVKNAYEQYLIVQTCKKILTIINNLSERCTLCKMLYK